MASDDPTPPALEDTPAGPIADESAWVDLRTAEHHTGIPISTLRRWHRQGAVPSRITHSDEGPKVELDADAVAERAAQRGLIVNLREVAPYDPPIPAPHTPAERAEPEPADEPTELAARPPADPEPDVPAPALAPAPAPERPAPGQETSDDADDASDRAEPGSGTAAAQSTSAAHPGEQPDEHPTEHPDGQPDEQPTEQPDGQPSEQPNAPSGATPPDRPAARPADAPAATAAEVREPDDAIIVPLDSWRRMLIQLGNLHETGQQLADAKERAARAETEAMFLKERLADLRRELDEAKSAVDAAGPAPGLHAPGHPVVATTPTPVPDIADSPATDQAAAGGDVARTTAGRAVDQVIDLAARTWKKRWNG